MELKDTCNSCGRHLLMKQNGEAYCICDDMPYHDDYFGGYEDYEPNPYDGTYSEE